VIDASFRFERLEGFRETVGMKVFENGFVAGDR
jgi:hypothetical protein